MSSTTNANLTEPVVTPIAPTAEDLAKATAFLTALPARSQRDEYVIGYLGDALEQVARGVVHPSTVRRCLALYRAWGERP